MEVLNLDVVLEAIRDVHELQEEAHTFEDRDYKHSGAPVHTTNALGSLAMDVTLL